jgi:hypothetical protein
MITNNTNIVTNGLVFHMDMGNLKSYAGPPITNILNQITPRGIGDNGSSYRAFNGTENVFIPTLGTVNNCPYVDIYNNYSSSGNCCPSLYDYGDSVSVSPNTQYTYGIVYNCFTGYNNPNYMYHYEYNGGTYITEYGLYYPAGNAYGGQNVVMGQSNWNWGSSIFTTQPSTNLLYTGLWYYQYSTWDRLYVAKILLTPGDYRNMHPKYWPAVGTTRTTTNLINDLTGTSTITVNNLNYGSDGSFSFNGSNSYLDAGNPVAYQLGSALTLEAWVNPTSTTGLGNILQKNNNGGYRYRIANGDLWAYSNGVAASTSGGPCTNGSWWHCVATFGPGGIAVYVNGVLSGSTTTAYAPSSVTSGNLQVGCYAPSTETFNGSISVARVYNRVLSATEIAQNFNAHRGRYGL